MVLALRSGFTGEYCNLRLKLSIIKTKNSLLCSVILNVLMSLAALVYLLTNKYMLSGLTLLVYRYVLEGIGVPKPLDLSKLLKIFSSSAAC